RPRAAGRWISAHAIFRPTVRCATHILYGTLRSRGSAREGATYRLIPSLREKCGVFGVYAPGEDVARVTFFGLHALQHRGQESAGIATSDGERINVYAEMGLVAQIFHERRLATLVGDAAIGHTRYSTTASSAP